MVAVISLVIKVCNSKKK
ncbi:MAG: hypothetical protein PUK55_07600 [Clostridiales bacterium]|nr:hypothetical protein [Clostridiales bacterium]